MCSGHDHPGANVISDHVRNPRGTAAARLAGVAISATSASELRYGCRKTASSQLTERVEAVFREIKVL